MPDDHASHRLRFPLLLHAQLRWVRVLGVCFYSVTPSRHAGRLSSVSGGGRWVSSNNPEFVPSAAARAVNGEVKVGKGGDGDR